jgi:S-adenosylmethionine-diacylglycerol 3-amino-3-carboxypropyl transferase
MSMHQPSASALFPPIRYAQCWEDADILLQALDVQAGHHCLSIASAGDNTLALLSHGPERVVAIDYNPSQIACLELRVGAYQGVAAQRIASTHWLASLPRSPETLCTLQAVAVT